MPSGKEHHEIWKASRPLAFISCGMLGAGMTMATGSLVDGAILGMSGMAGYLLGDLVTPDQDLVSIDRGESIAIKSVIFLPLVAWTTLYARIMQGMGGHRGFWSHSLLVSTFIRLCWFLFPVVMLLKVMGLGDILPQYDLNFLGVFYGLSIADALHIIADHRSDGRKKFISRTKARRVREAGD